MKKRNSIIILIVVIGVICASLIYGYSNRPVTVSADENRTKSMYYVYKLSVPAKQTGKDLIITGYSAEDGAWVKKEEVVHTLTKDDESIYIKNDNDQFIVGIGSLDNPVEVMRLDFKDAGDEIYYNFFNFAFQSKKLILNKSSVSLYYQTDGNEFMNNFLLLDAPEHGEGIQIRMDE